MQSLQAGARVGKRGSIAAAHAGQSSRVSECSAVELEMDGRDAGQSCQVRWPTMTQYLEPSARTTRLSPAD